MLTIETEEEDDARWIAEIPEIPDATVYGADRQEAILKAQALALRVLADRIDNGEDAPQIYNLFTE